MSPFRFPLLLSYVFTLAFAGPAVAEGLELSVRGELTVDDPLDPMFLRQELRILFEFDPQNPVDPLTEDLELQVFFPNDPDIIIFVPAGTFVEKKKGFVCPYPTPLSPGLSVELVTAGDPNDPNSPPTVVDLLHELADASVRIKPGRKSGDPAELHLDLLYVAQHPQPCFLPVNRVAQKVRLTIGANSGETVIPRFEFAGAATGGSGLIDLAARGEVWVDDPVTPTLLSSETSVRLTPDPNGNGVNPTAEDVRLHAFFPTDPDIDVFVPAGCFEAAPQGGFGVTDPYDCGVQTALVFPAPNNDPQAPPTVVDLADETLALDVRYSTDPDIFKVAALYGSQAPQPCFLPLNRAPVSLRFQIGDDSGTVPITQIGFASE